jgi:tetratricopeptide (TPR) repeat protein
VECEKCHFPLVEGAPATGPDGGDVAPEPPLEPVAAGGQGASRAGSAPSGRRDPAIPPFRIARPRRPGPAANVSLSLWLGVGSFLALLLVMIAVQANLERDRPQVEGSSREQQEEADGLRAALEKDSTDTRARVRLADILFDTGNWSEAIVHYRSAVRHDSSLVTATIDLGVCYYNLSVPDEAERLFHLALSRDPQQPFALFNLGIVHEQRGETDKALQYFHQALQTSPPDNMKPALMEAMQRVVKASGKQAPPLDQGR